VFSPLPQAGEGARRAGEGVFIIHSPSSGLPATFSPWRGRRGISISLYLQERGKHAQVIYATMPRRERRKGFAGRLIIIEEKEDLTSSIYTQKN